ncbi:uncharacterized protein LOC111919129 [Lactuca sativa]|uniref:uncharacterized protein LOC111919129 n=1 Tax=Lactuca sativa TaxID=4236 RepID=UPI000CD84073|nr:uncharacterized protein LOC111919129 [Lactuca sativa]
MEKGIDLEINLEMERKMKPNFVSSIEGSGMRPNVVDMRGKGQQDRGHCGSILVNSIIALVHLVPIPLCGNNVIVGMDLLSSNGAVIDCEKQLVRVRTLSRGELVIQGERLKHGLIMCSAARARSYLHQGCSAFVAYIMDTRDLGKAIVDDVPIVRDYPDVFPKDLLGVPPESQRDFRIDLVPGATPIVKALYRLV